MTPIRAYPITAFAILACLVGWIVQIVALLQGSDGTAGLLPLGPLIAAGIVSASLGRAGLTVWWRRLTMVRAGAGWWLLAALGPIGLMVLAILINAALGAPLPARAQLANWTDIPGNLLGVFLMIGIGEEAGWTAFATPRLLARYRFLAAFVVIAAIRVCWHLPLMLTGELPPMLGVVANAGFQFMVLWAYVRSGGVWWLAVIWHTVHNVVGGSYLYRMTEGADQVRLGVILAAVYWLAAGAVLLLDRKRLAGGPASAAASDPGAPLAPATPR